MSRDPARAATQFFGGRVCLDFANTLDWRTSDEPQELIPDYASLLSWSERRGTLPLAASRKLKARAASREAEAILQKGYALRRDIWTISDALRDGRSADLRLVNQMLSGAPRQPELMRQDRGYRHALAGADVSEPLWPVLWSLTALLASDDAGRIGCCEAEGCGWFFVDESPNRTRRWCSSEVCGNRERARRAYAKRKGSA
ncbi:CGNR zinc finger domain-containing protein [Bradyrhizobium jicamae]|uniref:CGNR zinc finger domain-containing protein n=1 Tax=Bradyrhizobium jicamae TaxID=280332 RepID=A0ABS5FLT9_9BRAD|nr:ABATE domain-containing protein [Bradyrhizobium jicamae]MBR0797753.1 CGNR zinc finger domain-containing protein [Bradyrhizobium jicamae]MBR0933293.1 CGNR zinc finger domain-containing protein [Bradyrhizobium jicamae]